MRRRRFLQSLAGAAGATLLRPRPSEAALPKAKITRVRIYEPPNVQRLVNQSNMLATVETDIGITGIGEGGSRDMLEQCAGSLIGKNPFQIERIWQHMYIDWFYPPGREKVHALGAMDLALWDIKGKALKVPVHELLGGVVRNHCECYSPGGGGGGPAAQADPLARIRDSARQVIEQGFRAYRIGGGDGGGAVTGGVFNTHERVRQIARVSKAIREGVGENGDWMIDLHQRFDYADALRACRLMEEFEPYTVEDPGATSTPTRTSPSCA